VIGVFCNSCSHLSVALNGLAEGRPAEGRPAEWIIGSRKADDRETADNGVLEEIADGSDTAERIDSESDREQLGKFAVTGVDSLSVGLADMVKTKMSLGLTRQLQSIQHERPNCEN